jgi:hypothetical protein
VLAIGASTAAFAQTREEKVLADRLKVEADALWIYNDLDKAYETALLTNKPILVAMRCIPCEECVKLDDELVGNDKKIRPLLEQFVCVRIVGTNGLDLDAYANYPANRDALAGKRGEPLEFSSPEKYSSF